MGRTVHSIDEIFLSFLFALLFGGGKLQSLPFPRDMYHSGYGECGDRRQNESPNCTKSRCQRPRLLQSSLIELESIPRELTCQGRSQSRAMGITPSQHPRTVPIAGKTRARSTKFRVLHEVIKMKGIDS